MQRPQELQAFLRRVEDSIGTPTDPMPLPPPPTTVAPASNSSSIVKLLAPPPNDGHRDVTTPTFDAGTQTSPTSLSRSSSFLWMSDCNCSGSVEGVASSDRLAMRTPDSAAEIDDEEDDDDSSVSLSRSVDGGAGVESGIGTGSPPPRDRRRRPMPDEVQTKTEPMSETSTCSSTEDERAPRSRASSACATKKREKVRRRETWEKIRRRHPCKRVPSKAARGHKDKSEVVWVSFHKNYFQIWRLYAI